MGQAGQVGHFVEGGNLIFIKSVFVVRKSQLRQQHGPLAAKAAKTWLGGWGGWGLRVGGSMRGRSAVRWGGLAPGGFGIIPAVHRKVSLVLALVLAQATRE